MRSDTGELVQGPVATSSRHRPVLLVSRARGGGGHAIRRGSAKNRGRLGQRAALFNARYHTVVGSYALDGTTGARYRRATRNGDRHEGGKPARLA